MGHVWEIARNTGFVVAADSTIRLSDFVGPAG